MLSSFSYLMPTEHQQLGYAPKNNENLWVGILFTHSNLNFQKLPLHHNITRIQ